MTSMSEYQKVLEGRQDNVVLQLDSARQARVQRNRLFVKSMLEIVILCGKQNIALRGHRDDSQHYDSGGNPGNFQALVSFRVKSGDLDLADHLGNAARNATYRSKTTQNELIEVCGEYILGKIKQNVVKAKYFSILADEATDVSNKCQVPVVVRYVESGSVSEDFVGFVEMTERPTGQAIATELVKKVDRIGLDMNNCRGQCYDGAGNMAGKLNGAAAIIKRDYPDVEFTHCRSHALNLAVMKGCNVQMVKNMLNSEYRW